MTAKDQKKMRTNRTRSWKFDADTEEAVGRCWRRMPMGGCERFTSFDDRLHFYSPIVSCTNGRPEDSSWLVTVEKYFLVWE